MKGGCHASVLAMILSCGGGSEPAEDPFLADGGRWLLVSVNGQSLPAQGVSATMTAPVSAGRLMLASDGPSVWEWCGHGNVRGYALRYVLARENLSTVGYVGSGGVDTLRLTGETVTFEHNRDAGPTDLLRFRRLAAGEATGSVCAL